MNSNPKITATVRQLLSEYLTKARSLYKEEEITDFVIRFDLENGTLSVSDDNDVILSHVSLPADIELDDDTSQKEALLTTLRLELKKMDMEQCFDTLNVFKPFSFIAIDEDLSEEDLLIVDDKNFIVGDDLLKGLEDDLDSFLENLLKNN